MAKKNTTAFTASRPAAALGAHLAHRAPHHHHYLFSIKQLNTLGAAAVLAFSTTVPLSEIAFGVPLLPYLLLLATPAFPQRPRKPNPSRLSFAASRASSRRAHRYLSSHGIDPFVVATHSDGGQGAFDYWIYPLGDGSSGYLQPGKSLHQPDALRAMRVRVNADIVAVLGRARGIQRALADMDLANAAQRRLSAGCQEGTTLDRTRTSVTAGLRKKLKDIMLDFQALRQRMMSEYKDTVERRYYTLTGEVPEDEVIERIISEGRGEEIMSAAVAEHGKGAVLAALNEIQDRHDAAREVERSLLELHQVFLDMAVVVQSQGDKLQNIEHHVSNARDYVHSGNKELGKAREHQRGSRKCLCIGIILLLLLILIVIVPIATSLRRSIDNRKNRDAASSLISLQIPVKEAKASLIAGFVVCYGLDDSHTIDLSVRGRLAALKNRGDSSDLDARLHPRTPAPLH
ncbi:Syntaxin-related protein KNOLLE [Triticum urartu]|uniref:Syntaxin-related protein KNOLLE n=1 Tax=Triticum urartu TaxID=4572 RepID=M7Z0B9_TRIUA|nr:Syntaxin-related protein KNOLLE [Triticum urartu]